MAEIPSTSRILLETDASKDFLNSLLGQGWSNWGEGLGGETGAELMLQIFGAFNSVALAIISGLFLWVSALAAAGTAHEGVAFGKKYSSLWMPIRFVGSMGALAPIFKGLSLFQIALLASIGWSINLGNFVWELGVDYFVEQGGQLSVSAPDQTVPAYNTLSNGVLKSLTYQYYMANRAGKSIASGGEWGYESNPRGGGEYKFKFNGDMGAVSIKCDDPNNAMCIAKVNAVTSAIEALSETASQLADPDILGSNIDSSALSRASATVHKEILFGMQSYAANSDTYLHQKLQAFQDMADQYGWFMVGSSYWIISWINQEVREFMYSGIDYSSPSVTWFELKTWFSGLQDWKATKIRLENYIQTGYTNRKGVDRETLREVQVTDVPDNYIRKYLNKFTDPLGYLPKYIIKKISKEDPICVFSDIGDVFINTAWTAFGVLSGIKIATTATRVASVGYIDPEIDIFISFLLSSFCVPIMLYGIILAYYLPAIPFIRWISALAGWVILIIESLIAAPLWIAAHALPEGDGAAGQHGRRGYVLFLAILIRPSLMIAGFFCAMILISVIGKLIGQSFMLFTDGVAQTKILGPTALISMLVLLGIIVIMLANKFFGLIHYVPEHVTNWIGQQMHSLGEKEDQSGAKNIFAGSMNVINSGAHGLEQKGSKMLSSLMPKKKNPENTISPAQTQERNFAATNIVPQNQGSFTTSSQNLSASDKKESTTGQAINAVSEKNLSPETAKSATQPESGLSRQSEGSDRKDRGTSYSEAAFSAGDGNFVNSKSQTDFTAGGAGSTKSASSPAPKSSESNQNKVASPDSDTNKLGEQHFKS